MTDVPTATDADRSLLRRGSRALFTAVALGTTGFVASLTVSPLIGQDLTGSATLSGIPWSAGVLGTGLASAALAQLMARRGRGAGLVAGYLIGAAGAVGAVVATAAGLFPIFVLAVLLMGAGNAANHLSRYAASERYPLQRRAQALGTVVWAGTIGGVAGPSLLAPSGRAGASLGLPALAGPLLVAAFGFAGAAIVVSLLLRRSSTALRAHDVDELPGGASLFEMWRSARAQAATVALAVSQTVMVLIMAMTPLHMKSMGHGLGSVGLVISAHIFGMYGLSPLSGWLSDRLGRIATILLGFALLIGAALLAAAAPAHAGLMLAVPLFLLGWGWSLSFVSASAMLTEGLSYVDRTRLQGATDTLVWTSAAIAGLGSGFLVGGFGYATLCVVGGALVVGPVLFIAGRRAALAPATA